jgi:homoserine dehydrogenase
MGESRVWVLEMIFKLLPLKKRITMSATYKQTKLVIGLFGFGVVGESLYKVLAQTPSLQAEVRRVCIKNPEKERNAPAELFTTNADELLNDTAINVIVELTSDPEAAYRIITTGLRKSKAVVSAGKKTIAEHLPELIELQQQYNVPLLYEAACCASIPVIRNLEEYYDNDLLHSISGIVNGSTNYILTRMAAEKLSFTEALKEAQAAGFAEADPSLDIEGKDAVNKLAILAPMPTALWPTRSNWYMPVLITCMKRTRGMLPRRATK